MARKLGQTIARVASTWLVRVYLGRDSPEKLRSKRSSRMRFDRGVPETSLLSTIRSSVSSLLVKLGKQEMMVYLSYSHHDSEVAGQVAEGLKAAGIRLFHDTSTLSIRRSSRREYREGTSEACGYNPPLIKYPAHPDDPAGMRGASSNAGAPQKAWRSCASQVRIQLKCWTKSPNRGIHG